MPGTRFFFSLEPHGTPLGVQAGLGNFVVSLEQFITPWISGLAAFGASQILTIGGITKINCGLDRQE